MVNKLYIVIGIIVELVLLRFVYLWGYFQGLNFGSIKIMNWAIGEKK